MKTTKHEDVWEDPIVAEVRQAGEEMAREAGYDLHRLCERLREEEHRHPELYGKSRRQARSRRAAESALPKQAKTAR